MNVVGLEDPWGGLRSALNVRYSHCSKRCWIPVSSVSLVSRDDNELRTTVYRKPTHTDRLLDESSYSPTSHKAPTIKTLTRRSQLVCDTSDSLRDENRCLERVFHKNTYNTDFIRRNIYWPTEADATNRNPTPLITATIPYIRALLRPSHGSYSPTTSV